jgi:hypothetical protein
MADPLIYYIGNAGPAITMKLSSLVGDYDLVVGQQVKIRARPAWSSTTGLDVDAVVDVDADTVSYTPAPGDFTQVGPYKVWAHVEDINQDSTEVDLMVFDHAPGEGQRVGAIWRAARALEPISWDSLRGYSDYGDVELQRVIELAKLRVIGVAVPVADEDSLDPRIVDFVAKKALADNVLSAAISFWTDQVVQQSARGNTEEVVTYPDRIKAATEAIKRYRDDLDRQAGELAPILGPASTYDAPMVDSVGPMLTPGLDEYPALPVTTQCYSTYPWWTRR